jgi:cell division protein ZapB
METALKSLEGKLGQFVELCHQLQADNLQLRQELASAVNQSKRLEEKISSATTRLETLLSQIPADDDA